MKRSVPLPSRTRLRRRKRLNSVNNRRKRETTLRAFGEPGRRAWMRQKACCVCGRRPVHNAHAVIGGTSYRADACFIVPLCILDCHPAQEGRTPAFERERGLPEGFLLAAAARYDAEWRSLQATN